MDCLPFDCLLIMDSDSHWMDCSKQLVDVGATGVEFATGRVHDGHQGNDVPERFSALLFPWLSFHEPCSVMDVVLVHGYFCEAHMLICDLFCSAFGAHTGRKLVLVATYNYFSCFVCYYFACCSLSFPS